jgi:hypothetical protein
VSVDHFNTEQELSFQKIARAVSDVAGDSIPVRRDKLDATGRAFLIILGVPGDLAEFREHFPDNRWPTERFQLVCFG